MDIGISYWFGYASFPDERVNLIKNAGFNNVSLHWTNEYIDITGDKNRVAQVLERQSIDISSLHLSYDMAHFIWEDSEQGEKYRRTILDAILDAKALGTNNVVLHTNGTVGKNLITRMGRIFDVLEFADKNNINMCVENLQIEDNVDLFQRMDDFHKLVFCYDCGHNNIRKCPFARKNNEQIRYIHISDNDGVLDLHSLPYEGSIDWNNELDILAMLNKPMILEVHSDIVSSKMAENFLDSAFKAAIMIDDEIKRRQKNGNKVFFS